jgi:TonB family protein
VPFDGDLNTAHREKTLAGLDSGGGQQRDYLRDRDSDGAIWVCACESLLHGAIREQFMELAEQKTVRAETRDSWRKRALFVILAIAAGGAMPARAQSSGAVEERRPVKHLVQPTLSDLARKLNLTGTVRIEVTIAPDGSVKRTRVLGGHPVLAQDAERAAQRSTFEPGPRETVETIEFKF